ncbi:hypothetical protein VTL71DRAFT_11199 [Oculimacula yallundae]|uniref:Uncharacterized protein n=1 Tax=Oculimacula yallundae TaxID=86028 RepID=A0ABR4CVS7_9HELO
METSPPRTTPRPYTAERVIIQVPGRTPNEKFIHVSAKKLPVPVLLLVCYQSRVLGLNHYKLVLDTNSRPAKEDLPHLRNLPAVRGNRTQHQLLFPFERKAMMYIDLRRDYFVDSERKTDKHICGDLPSDFRGGRWWSKAELQDPRFTAWPIQHWFEIEDFRKAVPEKVLSRICNFALNYRHVPNPRYDIEERHCKIMVFKDAFERRNGRRFFIRPLVPKVREEDGNNGSRYKATIVLLRSLPDVAALKQAVDEGMVWDWLVHPEIDEKLREFLGGKSGD